MSREKPTKCYIARDPQCGHIVAAYSFPDDTCTEEQKKDRLKDMAKEVAAWIRRGEEVSIVTDEEVRLDWCSCRREAKEAALKQMQIELGETQ